MEAQAILISVLNRKTAVTFRHILLLVVLAPFFRYDQHKDIFFLFNYLAIGDPRDSKQSFHQSITSGGGMYLCAFKIESYVVIKASLQSTFLCKKY